MCICSLRYPAYNARAPYHLWPARLYSFSHYLVKTWFLKKNLLNTKLCLAFLYYYCLKHFSFQKQLSEIWSKMFIDLHVKCPLFWSDFNETWILTTDFWKISKYQLSLLLHRESCRFTKYHITNKCTNCMSFIFKSLF